MLSWQRASTPVTRTPTPSKVTIVVLVRDNLVVDMVMFAKTVVVSLLVARVVLRLVEARVVVKVMETRAVDIVVVKVETKEVMVEVSKVVLAMPVASTVLDQGLEVRARVDSLLGTLSPSLVCCTLPSRGMRDVVFALSLIPGVTLTTFMKSTGLTTPRAAHASPV